MPAFDDAFFVHSATQPVGTYHFRHMLISSEFDFVAAWQAELEGPNTSPCDPEEEADQFIKKYTLIHESRHFHDCFGTIGGISLFLRYADLLGRFYNLTADLRRNGIRWQLPTSVWVKASDCPKPVADLFASYEQLRNVNRLFLGDFSPRILPTRTSPTNSFARVFVPSLGASITTFPMELRFLDNNQVAVCFYPLGFTSLVEGNAHELTRYFALSLSELGQEAVDRRFNTRAIGRPLRAVTEDHALSSAVYNVTNQALSRYLRLNPEIQQQISSRGLSPKYPPTLLFEIADSTLDFSHIFEKDGQLTCFEPGGSFEQLVRSIDPVGYPVNPLPDWPGRRDGLLRWRRFLRQLPSIDATVTGETERANPAEVLTAYAVHDIILPLIEARLRTDNKVFTNPEMYKLMFAELPRVPFFSMCGQPIMSAKGVPSIVQRKWDEALVLGSVMKDIFEDRTVIRCPRAFASLPGIDREEWAFQGTCDEHVAAGACSGWSWGALARLPLCKFGLGISVVFGEEARLGTWPDL